MSDITSPADLWSVVLASIEGKAPLSWARSLEIARWDERGVVMRPQAGSRGLMNFFNDARRGQLAGLFQQVLGRPVRVTVEAAPLNMEAPAAGQADVPPVAQAKATGGPGAARGASGGATGGAVGAAGGKSAPPSGALSTPSPRNSGGPALDRQQAMALPLVRQVMEIFDATVIEIRPEAQIGADSAAAATGSTAAPEALLIPEVDAVDASYTTDVPEMADLLPTEDDDV